MRTGKFTLLSHSRRPHHRRAPSRGTCASRCSARPARGGLYLFQSLCMEAPTTELPPGCLQEALRDNVRIRLHAFKTDSGETRHTVELSAWNAWADQGKVIEAIGGIDLATAQEVFSIAAENIRGFDWVACEFVMDDHHSPEAV